MGRTSQRLAIAAAMATLSSLGMASTAGAHHSSPAAPTDPVTACGQSINQDTKLTHDVGPCPGDGITIGQSGTSTDPITLDLNGHTVTGALAPDSRGLAVSGRTNVELKGPGTIRGFSTGIAIEGGSSNTVDNVTVDLGLSSVLSDYGEGIQVNDSDSNTVKNSRVSLSGPYSGITVLGDSDYNQIGVVGGGNTVENNIEPSGLSNQDDGIRLEPDYVARENPDHNKIEGNAVRGNGLDGIAIFAAAVPVGGDPLACVTTANEVRSNTVEKNGFHTYTHRKGDGIRIFPRSCGNIVDGNTVTGNAGSGIRIDGPFKNAAGAVTVPGSLNNTITNNSPVTGNYPVPDPLAASDPRRESFDLYDGNDQCDNNSWSGNDANATRNQNCIG